MANLLPSIKDGGVIKTEQIQNPAIQLNEMSDEDFRLIILTMSGISHNGSVTPAQNPIVSQDSTRKPP